MYRVSDSELLASLIIELRNALSNREGVYVGSSFAETNRADKQVLVSITDSSLEKYSSSDFYGVLHSIVSLASYPVEDWPAEAIAWVSDNNRSETVVPPGYYFIHVVPVDEENSEVYVTPYILLKHNYEVTIGERYFLPEEFSFAVEASIKVYDLSIEGDPRELIRDTHYELETFTIHQPGSAPTTILAITINSEYLYDGAPIEISAMRWLETSGPFEARSREIRDDILPGVLLYFSKHVHVEDKQLVVVEDTYKPLADVYAVKWNISLSCEVFAGSQVEVNELADDVKSYVMRELFRLYGNFSISISDISVSKNAEPRYDTPQEYTYQTTITFRVMIPWLWAETYITPLNSISIVENVPDELSDLEAAKEEKGRFIWTTSLSSPIASQQIEYIR